MTHRPIIAAALGIAALLAGSAQAQQLPSDPYPKGAEVSGPLKPGANSFAEGQARELLQQNGYSGVSSLVNDKDGIWHGTAVKNEKTFDVSIDYQGRIAAK